MITVKNRECPANDKENRITKRLVSGQAGTVAVEFALILPILITLIFGIYQFGMAYNNYLAISHAAREGARMAATGNYDQQKVEARAFPAKVSSINVSYPSGNVHGEPVRVEVKSDFILSIPFMPKQTIVLHSAAEMRIEV